MAWQCQHRFFRRIWVGGIGAALGGYSTPSAMPKLAASKSSVVTCIWMLLSILNALSGMLLSKTAAKWVLGSTIVLDFSKIGSASLWMNWQVARSASQGASGASSFRHEVTASAAVGLALLSLFDCRSCFESGRKHCL